MSKNRDLRRIRIIIIAFLIVTAGTLVKVWSYTTATVINEASVTITESENALIALNLPDDIIDVYQGVTEIPCGTIKNNMPVPLNNLIVSGGGYSADDYSLGLDDSTSICLHIPPDEETGVKTYPGLVMAVWDGGSAEIEFEVIVRVVSPPNDLEPTVSDTAITGESTTREIPLPEVPEGETPGFELNGGNTENCDTGGIVDSAE